ncbi:MAG TPA: thioredoxin [Flavobacteriia bacterium]|jgi:thiol-disulfide isomerase/thioredoxin|nr:thioredoxin [Flavobacteriia bacterium]
MNYNFAETLEDANEFIRENPAVLVFFSDESCNVGDALSPKLQAMVQEKFPEMKFLEINVHMLPEARGYYNVFVIPTVLVYFDGRETIRQARHISVPKLAQEVERVYNIMFS